MAGINFDFTTGVLPGAITFTRASIGTYTNAAGTLITAGNDVARLNYIGGVSNLLIEGSATNLFVQSNAFSTTWTLTSGGVVTATQFVSPDGTNDGWSFGDGGSFGWLQQLSISLTAIPYTLSLWVKQITGTITIQFNIGSVVTAVSSVTTTLTRRSVTATPGVESGVNFRHQSNSGNVCGIFGAQVETGSVPTSYIPTTTAAVTRAADSAVFTIPSGINQLVYTFDDNSTQTVAVSPGSYTIPTNLARPNIKSVVGRYAFDFTSGSLPAGMTFTRPSIGTYVNVSGTLITAGNDVARFNYVSGVSNLLIEPSATNLLTQSNNFASADWVAGNAGVVTAAQFISPDGTNDGWSLTSGSGNAYVYEIFNFLNVPYTLSVWAKRIVGVAPLQLLMQDQSSGSLTTSTTIARFSFTATPAAAFTANYFQVIAGSGSTNGIFGGQFETGSKMTSYIPTTTAPVTRAADAATFTIPAGVNALLYTFDDGSTQQVSVTPGSYTIPVNLNRPNIKSIQGLGGFDFTSGTLPPGITFTRASIGTYFDGGNILRTASNNVARMNYVSGVSCLLIEGSATNLALQSNAFSTTWTTGNSAIITAAQFVSPDGTNDGWSLNGSLNAGYLLQAATWAAGPYTASIWAKLMVGTAPINLMFNFSANTTAVSATLARVFSTGTPGSGGGSIGIQVRDGSGPATTHGIFGFQVETGSTPTSYIPTTTTSVTRAVDQATFTIPTGVTQLTYTFDDNSTQTVSATPGSYTIPVNLSRPNIKSIAWVTTAPITPTPSPARVGAFQSFGLAANIPLQLTAGGVYYLYILNTGPGNLYVSTGNTPAANATSMLIPPLKTVPLTTTGAPIWLAADQDGTVSIMAVPR